MGRLDEPPVKKENVIAFRPRDGRRFVAGRIEKKAVGNGKRRPGQEPRARLAKEPVIPHDVVLDGVDIELEVDVGMKTGARGGGQIGDGGDIDGIEHVEGLAARFRDEKKIEVQPVDDRGGFLHASGYSGWEAMPSDGRSLFHLRTTLWSETASVWRR